MKKNYYKGYSLTPLVLLLLLLFTKVNSQPRAPQGSKWEIVSELSDEFNAWDNSKWFKPLWNYGVPVQMRAQNSGVTNGNLWIKASLDNNSQRWFETSRVQSRAQINYPMYTESRIRTAHISAYTTFWLNNGDINNRNEIDIIENNSKPSCGCQPDFPWKMNSQYFHVVNGDTRRAHGNFDNRTLSNDNPKKGVRWNEEYHTVGVWWKDSKNIQFYLDGEPAGSVVSERDFTRDLNVIWDLWTADFNWLGGLAAKNDLNNDNINTMYVDWVHTYTLEESLGVNDANLKTFKMYPSPVSDILHFKALEADLPIIIYDYTGRKLIETKSFNSNTTINVSNIQSGAYFVKIEGYITKRLIIK